MKVALEDEGETATQKYDRFITANKVTAEEVMPVKVRSRKARYSNDTRVVKARKEINEANES